GELAPAEAVGDAAAADGLLAAWPAVGERAAVALPAEPADAAGPATAVTPSAEPAAGGAGDGSPGAADAVARPAAVGEPAPSWRVTDRSSVFVSRLPQPVATNRLTSTHTGSTRRERDR